MAPSNSPLIGYGLTLQEPKLYDVLQQLKTQMLISLNCVKVGKITAFYPATNTVDVQILFQRVMKNGGVSSYPKLQGCPVITMQGGGAALQLPIAAGDQCLVLFSDRNLDNWYLNGNEQPPIDGRLHDLSDGIALVGMNWKSDDTIPTASTTEARLILSDGTTKVGLESGKITVQNASENLLTVLGNLTTAVSDLITVLNSLTTTGSATTQTISAATVAALVPVSTELTAVHTALNALLY